MISKDDVDKVLEGYDKENMVVATLGSHSALQIMKGARDEGLRNLLLCTEKTGSFYRGFSFVDEVLEVGSYADVLSEEVQGMLRDRNCVLIPHGSFVEYVGSGKIMESLRVPLQGNRRVLEWESDRRKQFEWFAKAGARTPREYKSPYDIGGLVMVKFPGAKGGRGYFLAKDCEEFKRKMAAIDLPENVKKDRMIQEYVIGTRFYPHFFYSPLDDSLELLGMDVRYESNIDGLARIPGSVDVAGIEPSYVVTGNLPVVMRESLLPGLMSLGRGLVDSSKKLFSPGMLGPFCVEMVCLHDLGFVCFEVSARIVAGTNLYVNGSPYSDLLYGEPMSTGRRICRELKEAAAAGRLSDVVY
ncbi:MAG: formate--phosphoribosylaminoimidazolecarboxamide ligase [Candidatus Altiarchaeota archaeon]|nr:formate--phosphoribosylaminoimidazolecarboxamide ligase [Candidatus Altiarchaeota archaeon]